MTALIRSFAEIRAADLAEVGGKGANLGELTRAGFEVPLGFCVTTHAFELFMAPARRQVGDRLDALAVDDVEAVRRVGGDLRARLHELPLPQEVEAAVVAAWLELGDAHAYAVRSSATAEDLPHASFAGQQDTYLNVRGRDALLAKVKACFVSLFTDRAILYRIRNRFDHRRVALAAVVQRMVQPEVAGILFTADPVTGHRDVASIDASFGLGEALVSGLVSADLYRVDKRTRQLLERRIATKQLAIRSLPGGGTETVDLEAPRRSEAALNDAQVLRIAEVGSSIEAHFGAPQDVEWALAGDTLYVTQSRPITSLYPLPEPAPDDDALHVYFSFSHFQVMTDAMKPLALSWLRTILPVGHADGRTESRYMLTAGGRIYGDLSPILRHPVGRRLLLRGIGNADALAARALADIVARPEFQRRGERVALLRTLIRARRLPLRMLRMLLRGTPEGVTDEVDEIIHAETERIGTRLAETGAVEERLEIAIAETRGLFGTVISRWAPFMLAGFAATALLHALMRGRPDTADDLAAVGRGLSGNVATEMNLAVGDLADLARRSEALLERLSRPDADVASRLAAAAELPGGDAFVRAWDDFLAEYGARGPSEIDLSRPRWSEDPASLLQMVINAAQQSSPGAHREHHARLVAEGERAAEALVEAARAGPSGPLRGRAVRRLARVSRALLPLREHHKFFAMKVMALAKRVLLDAGERLHAEGRLDAAADVWFLTMPELQAALGGREEALAVIATLVRTRKADHQRFRTLTPPRVMTNRGEAPAATLDGDGAPDGALIGSPVSAGVVEGVARVVLDPATEVLRPGEILVAPFTDPGWTPLFVNAAGLVTEVGGLMTHGSLVAREYGIPAVVGVVDATREITSGQRVRIDGSAGWVEILDPDAQEADPKDDPEADAHTDPETVLP